MNWIIDKLQDYFGYKSYVIYDAHGNQCYYYFNQRRSLAEKKALKMNHRYGHGHFHVEEFYW